MAQISPLFSPRSSLRWSLQVLAPGDALVRGILSFSPLYVQGWAKLQFSGFVNAAGKLRQKWQQQEKIHQTWERNISPPLYGIYVEKLRIFGI